MSWTLATSADALDTAGANVNTTIIADADALEQWADEAEALCCLTARYDLVNNYANLNAQGKALLSSIVCAYVSQKIICYDPSALGLNTSALKLNMFQTQIAQGLSLIEGDKIKTYLQIS